MTAYYNENDPYAAQWLRNLVAAGQIAPGDVDERDIRDVRPADLKGYAQCHFFAGIGGWSVALRLAAWPDNRPVWTGSCPCQPFSAAGKAGGFDDERHLWPAWHWLVDQCRPPIVFGEQVASIAGLGWLDLVQSGLEGTGYAVGAADICAAGVGAPHIRQRLWFVADASEPRRQAAGQHNGRQSQLPARSAEHGGVGGLGNPGSPRFQERERDRRVQRQAMGPQPGQAAERGSDAGGVVNAPREQVGLPGCARQPRAADSAMGHADREREIPLGGIRQGPHAEHDRTGPLSGFWSNAEWIACTDGKARPVGPGSFPLGHGIQRRASKLRAYGNAIVPQVAAEFIKAVA